MQITKRQFVVIDEQGNLYDERGMLISQQPDTETDAINEGQTTMRETDPAATETF